MQNNDTLWLCEGSDINPGNTTSGVGFRCWNQPNAHAIGAPSIVAANFSADGLERMWIAWETSAKDSHGAGHLAIAEMGPGSPYIENPTITKTLVASPPTSAMYNGNIAAAFAASDSNELCLQTFTPTQGAQEPLAYGPIYNYGFVTAFSPGLAAVYDGFNQDPSTFITTIQGPFDHQLEYATYFGSMYTANPTLNAATVGSTAAEAFWFPNRTVPPTITTAFKANDAGNICGLARRKSEQIHS